MRHGYYIAAVGAFSLPCLLLSGCLITHHKLPVPKPPEVTQTVAPAELVTRLNKNWEAVNNMTAKMDIQVSVLHPMKGLADDLPTVTGLIVMRKPESLRVVGRLIGVTAFDMASDGKDFTLSIPVKSKAYKGSNTLKHKSANPLENLRPAVFFDALLVRGLEPDEEFMVSSEDITVEDATKKHLFLVPEYILSIMKHKQGTQERTPVRVVRFHRDDLRPYQQDTYDNSGNIETQVTYSNYREFDSVPYPATILIKRPTEQLQLVLTVEDVKQNVTITDEQFKVNIPEATTITNLE
jgi:hypothetical protein